MEDVIGRRSTQAASDRHLASADKNDGPGVFGCQPRPRSHAGPDWGVIFLLAR